MQGSDSHLDYERLVADAMRDAMRNVLRNVLTEVAKTGLPGDHHFYISFSTTAPGVNLSKRLKEKYPDEMTIVLQHRFWDLIVHPERFEVKLQFNSIPEKLVVPFDAIRVFVDPSVRFGHQFEDPDADHGDGDAVGPAVRGGARGGSRAASSASVVRNAEKRRATQARKRTEKDVEQDELPADDKLASHGGVADEASDLTAAPEQQTAPASDATPAAQERDAGKVISLDKFRKK